MSTPASPLSTLASPMSTLASLAPGINPTTPVAPPPVPAAPVPAPQQQSAPQHSNNPMDKLSEMGGIIKGLYGKTLGKAMRGLGMVDTSYTVDPETGKTVPVQTKAPPGETAKAILAAGLLGMHGIGPEHGQLNFAQGLLSGLSGGMEASNALQQQKDAKARLESQQQFENELKAKQEKRADQDLQMRQTLDKAQIAELNIRKMGESYAFSRSKALDQRNDHLTTVQGIIESYKPYKNMFDELGAKPLADAATPAEYQKLLKDDSNDINLHNAIPVVTGYVNVETKNPDGTTTITPEPIGSVYSASDMKFTKSTLSDLKAHGVKEDDPMYQEIDTDIKNGTPVNPSKVAAVYRHMDSLQNWAKIQSDIARNNAEIARAQVGKRGDAVSAELATLKLEDYKQGRLGEDLFSAIGEPGGVDIGTGKDKIHVSIPTTPTGAYNFSDLKNPAMKSALRNYLWASHMDASKQYAEVAGIAVKAGKDPLKDPASIDAYKTVSTLSNMYHDLTGQSIGSGADSEVDPKVLPAVQAFRNSKITDPKVIQDSMNAKGYSQAHQDEIWKALGIRAPPAVEKPLLNPQGEAVVSGAKKAYEVLSKLPPLPGIL